MRDPTNRRDSSLGSHLKVVHGGMAVMVQPLIERFIAARVEMGLFTGDTPRSYRNVLLAFAEMLTKPLANLDRDDIAEILVRWGGADSTRLWRIAVLNSFFDWCVEERKLEHSPMTGLRTRRSTKSARPPRFLEPDEVGVLVAAAESTRDRLILHLAVQVGLRRKEIHELNVEDIDWTEGIIAIRGKGYGGEVSRIVPITTELRAALRAYLSEHPPFATDGQLRPLVRNRHGGRLSRATMSDVVSDIMIKAGVKTGAGDGKSLHALRHTCAQHLVDEGADIREVQQLLGHSSVTTTEIYMRRRIAAERLKALTEGRSYGSG